MIHEDLEMAGFEVTGHYPLLKTLFYTINTDTSTIYYGPEIYKLKKYKPDKIVETLSTLHAKITNDRYTTEEFMQLLFNEYSKTNEPLPISEIPSINQPFLSYDFYKHTTRHHNNHEVSFVIATRAYTTHPKYFIWIPSNTKGSGNYISHIKFRRAYYG